MDRDRIIQKVVGLKELIFELKEIGKIDKKDFYKNKKDISCTENYLRKALQIVIDIAADIVSKKRLGTVNTYYEAFQLLVDNGYLPEEKLNVYKQMVGMRNRIVHDYDKISKEKLYYIIENNIVDFEIFLDDIKDEIK